MNPGGDTADQMAKMTLEGIEVAAKISGSAAKSLAAMLYAMLNDKKKVKGKTRLDALLRSGKELKVFALRHDDLKVFRRKRTWELQHPGKRSFLSDDHALIVLCRRHRCREEYGIMVVRKDRGQFIGGIQAIQSDRDIILAVFAYS